MIDTRGGVKKGKFLTSVPLTFFLFFLLKNHLESLPATNLQTFMERGRIPRIRKLLFSKRGRGYVFFGQKQAGKKHYSPFNTTAVAFDTNVFFYLIATLHM